VTASGGDPVDAETLLRRVLEIVSNAKSMPLSSSVMISKDEVVELLEEGLARLPNELREARWMLKERDEFLAKVAREGDEILDAARLQAERMVERQEIVREARHTSKRVLEDAHDEARRLRLEAEDYCDQKLAAFEVVLERTTKTVQGGREKLRATPARAIDDDDVELGALIDDPSGGHGVFFDQDSQTRG
jgi:cell division septum initiation protein DivIVA